MRVRSERQAPEVKQRSLLDPMCPTCQGAGRVPWACNVRRGGCRGSVEYQTCETCLGRGSIRTGTRRFA